MDVKKDKSSKVPKGKPMGEVPKEEDPRAAGTRYTRGSPDPVEDRMPRRLRNRRPKAANSMGTPLEIAIAADRYRRALAARNLGRVCAKTVGRFSALDTDSIIDRFKSRLSAEKRNGGCTKDFEDGKSGQVIKEAVKDAQHRLAEYVHPGERDAE